MSWDTPTNYDELCFVVIYSHKSWITYFFPASSNDWLQMVALVCMWEWRLSPWHNWICSAETLIKLYFLSSWLPLKDTLKIKTLQKTECKSTWMRHVTAGLNGFKSAVKPESRRARRGKASMLAPLRVQKSSLFDANAQIICV